MNLLDQTLIGQIIQLIVLEIVITKIFIRSNLDVYIIIKRQTVISSMEYFLIET